MLGPLRKREQMGTYPSICSGFYDGVSSTLIGRNGFPKSA